MSKTRTQLRRDIARRTGQPFFRKFGVSNGDASGNGSTTTLVDTVLLKEEDDYWRGHFIYLPATDVVREITDFVSSTSTLTWLAATTSTTTGQDYELWSQFTPAEVHDAINFALDIAWPYLFEYGNDESLVIEEDAGLKYTLPTTTTIKRLCQVYINVYDNPYTGSVTTLGTTTQIKDTAASFTSADVGRFISVYKDGATANGQVRLISAVNSSTQVTVSTAFAEAVPVGAKYRVLDKTNPYPQQMLLQNWNIDKFDNPTELWLGGHPGGYEGHLIYLVYENEYALLTAEASTTTCPPEFIYNAALSYLYMIKLATAPVTEIPAWEALLRASTQAYQEFTKTKKFAHLPGTVLRHDLNVSGLPGDYPFR